MTDVPDLVAEMTKANYTAKEIAERLSVSTRTVYRMRKEAGVAKPPNQPISSETWNQARLLLEDGCSYAEVARSLGISRDYLMQKIPGKGWSYREAGAWATFKREMYANPKYRKFV